MYYWKSATWDSGVLLSAPPAKQPAVGVLVRFAVFAPVCEAIGSPLCVIFAKKFLAK
jgi:hypothetical protein